MSEANIGGNATSVSPTEPRHLRRVLIIWGVASVVVIAIWLALAQFILPQSASALDGADDFAFLVETILAIPVALFVFVFIVYSLFAFRSQGRPTEHVIPLHPSPSLPIRSFPITSLIPLFLLLCAIF